MTFKLPQVSDQLKKVIGEGIYFPLAFSEGKGNELLVRSSGLEVIYQSLSMLLSTRIGERYNNPEYGTRLHELIFRPYDNMLLLEIKRYVIDAVKRWEARITITDVLFDTSLSDENQINVNIQFLVNNTNVYGSFVYPFVREPMQESQFVQGNIFVVGRPF